jgi:hypothetical protein
MAAWPRWEEPLSTIQNTRLAEAYGCCVMAWVTRAMNGLMPVEAAQWPNTRARPTS